MAENATVGLVLISHSRQLAEGAADVAAQVSGGVVRIVGVGGTPDGALGTSLEALESAVEKVSSEMGVLIIPDLGSSVLTAKAYLADAAGTSLRIADAPFVEGAVAAAVAAAGGAALGDVAAAAEGARDVHKL